MLKEEENAVMKKMKQSEPDKQPETEVALRYAVLVHECNGQVFHPLFRDTYHH